MKKYNDTVSNKYFNSPNKSDVIQKRMNKTENKYHNDIIQKGWSNVFENAAKTVGNFFNGGETRAVTRSVEELNKIAQTIQEVKKISADQGKIFTYKTLIEKYVKDYSLQYNEVAHIIDLLPITDGNKIKYKNAVAPLNSNSTFSTSTTPTTTTTTLPGAPPRKVAIEPKLSVAEEEAKDEAKKQRQNQYIYNNIHARIGDNGGINVRNLNEDEKALMQSHLPGVDITTLGTINERQLDSIRRLGGYKIEPPIVAPEPQNLSPMSANRNDYIGGPTTIRHEIVLSQAPTPTPIEVRTPEQMQMYPNSPYNPEQISRYYAEFYAPKQPRRRNFWDKNSELWIAPHKNQQKTNFHLNQYQDLLTGNIKDKQQQYNVASDLVNQGFINRNTANRVLFDFNHSQGIPSKFNRLVPQAKPFIQEHFSTNIPLAPNIIARNAKNKRNLKTVIGGAIAGKLVLPIIGSAFDNELSKPKYTGDINDPDFDFNEYLKTKSIRNIRDTTNNFLGIEKNIKKSTSKNKKLRKGPLPVPGGDANDVDDAAEAAAAQGIVERVLTRTENTGKLMQPQEYSNAALAAMRTGYGAFGNQSNNSYERIIDEEGNTNWGNAVGNAKKAKMIVNWIKTAAKEKLKLIEPTTTQLARNESLRALMNGPAGRALSNKIKNDFKTNNPQKLLDAGEGLLSRALGVATFNPLKDLQSEFKSQGKSLPPSSFKQISDSEVDRNTQSRIDVARKNMLAPFNVPKYVSASTKQRPWTAEEEKQHAENNTRYRDLTQQRFEDAKLGTDLSGLNSNSSGMGASRFSGMPSMGLSSRTSNENVTSNENANKAKQQNAWKALAWSQGKYKPKNQLEELVMIGALQSLPQTLKEQLTPHEKNNMERIVTFFTSNKTKENNYQPLTPSALTGKSQPITPTPQAIANSKRISATPTVQRVANKPYTTPEQLKASQDRAIKAQIQELIQQKRY